MNPKDHDQAGPAGWPAERRLRAMFDGACEYIALLAPDGTLIETNRASLEFAGNQAADLIGRPFWDTPWFGRSPGEAERARQAIGRAARGEFVRYDATVRRPDGEARIFDLSFHPVRDERGTVILIVPEGRDVTEWRDAEAALRDSEERFRALATQIPQLVFRTWPSGERSWGSPQWEAFTGLSDARSRGFGWLDAIHPDDRAATREAWSAAQAQGTYDLEHRVRRTADGAYRWHRTRAVPLNQAGAESGEWVGTSTDIHDMRMLQEGLRALIGELQHRTRNLLAVVHSVMTETLAASGSLEEFGQRFEGRLAALGRAQGLLARGDGAPATMGELVRAELAAQGAAPDGRRVTAAGPDVVLPRRAVQTLALAIHELATNAVRHGALAVPAGRLEVGWSLRNGAEGKRPCLALDWRETGVELGAEGAVRLRGYGRELIEAALPYELDAETRLEFRPDGVRCAIALPLD